MCMHRGILPFAQKQFDCLHNLLAEDNDDADLGGSAALMLKLVLRFWTPRFRANHCWHQRKKPPQLPAVKMPPGAES